MSRRFDERNNLQDDPHEGDLGYDESESRAFLQEHQIELITYRDLKGGRANVCTITSCHRPGNRGWNFGIFTRPDCGHSAVDSTGCDGDAENHRILPGDYHNDNHSTMGADWMSEQADPEAVVAATKGLASQGVKKMSPTADFALFETIVKVAQTMLTVRKPIGIRSEGPYLKPRG